MISISSDSEIKADSSHAEEGLDSLLAVMQSARSAADMAAGTPDEDTTSQALDSADMKYIECFLKESARKENEKEGTKEDEKH